MDAWNEQGLILPDRKNDVRQVFAKPHLFILPRSYDRRALRISLSINCVAIVHGQQFQTSLQVFNVEGDCMSVLHLKPLSISNSLLVLN